MLLKVLASKRTTICERLLKRQQKLKKPHKRLFYRLNTLVCENKTVCENTTTCEE
jgi:hypothetical protein